MTTGSRVPAFLLCVLTLFCPPPTHTVGWKGRDRQRTRKRDPFTVFHPHFFGVFFWSFLGPHSWCMGVPRLGV